jgi:PAS domain S-box-containing protein
VPQDTEDRSIFELGNRQWDIPALRTLLEDVLPQNHAFDDFEVEHTFPAIGRRIMLLNARRVRKAAGADESILLAIEDATDRRRAEADLRDSEVRYRRLFESARDGILILDAGTGRILDSNAFMTELLGYTQDELLGKEIWQIGLFRDIDASRAAFRELQEKGYIRYENLPLQAKSGERTEVEFISNTYQVDGRLVIQCNIRDISQRLQLERTQAQAEALADLHRRKDEFLAMLSHELRNPLAPIMNAVHLLQLGQEGESPIHRQARTIIERQVGQLSHLINDLLEVSRITTGRIRLRRERVDLRGIVDRAVESARPLVEERRHELAVERGPGPIWVYADPARIEQVVVNLLTNAAKYTEIGGRIAVDVGREGEEAVVSVRDTGVGIAPELLPRIFDLFTQAERSLDRSEGGLGIGLTVVKRLVEMHGGRVEVYSVLGQGSGFVVRLPVPPPQGRPPEASSPAAARPPTRTLRVVVVDDNVDQADSTALLLRASGHEVRVAYSGKDALRIVAEDQPDVVFLDLGLPEFDGYEVARRLRQRPDLEGLVLVAMTGYGQESDRERSKTAGFAHHLVKPADPQRLQELLATVSETTG